MQKNTLLILICIIFIGLFTGLSLVEGQTPTPDPTWTDCGNVTFDAVSTTLVGTWTSAENLTGAPDGLYGYFWGDTAGGVNYFWLEHPVRIDDGDIVWVDATGNNSSFGFNSLMLHFNDDTDSSALTGTIGGHLNVTSAYNGKIVTAIGIYLNGYSSHWTTPGALDAVAIDGYGGSMSCPAAPVAATPLPQGALPCITATVSTTRSVMPTMTPLFAPSVTPGGPTPTPTTTGSGTTTGGTTTGGTTPISGTVSPDYDTGAKSFTSGLEGLAAVGSVNANDKDFLMWSNEIGPDAKEGVAMLHAGTGDEVTHTLSSGWPMVALFKTNGYQTPIGLTLSARTAFTMTAGDEDRISFWYLDTDYDGTGQSVWVKTPASQQISNVWRKFGTIIQPAGDYGKITAIGITDSYISDHFASALPCPSTMGCIYIDDLRITYGASNLLQLPVCSSAGPLTGTHVCRLTQTTVDVMAEYCTPPTGLWDIGGAVSWLGCSIKTFFTILPENSSQIKAVNNYAFGLEPFGSMLDTQDAFGYVQQKVSKYSDDYNYYTRNTTDWGKFFDWTAVMHLQLPAPAGGAAIVYDASNCKFAAFNPDIPLEALRSACFIEHFGTDSGLVAPMQILIDLFCVVAVIMYIRNNWMASMAGGGDE